MPQQTRGVIFDAPPPPKKKKKKYQPNWSCLDPWTWVTWLDLSEIAGRIWPAALAAEGRLSFTLRYKSDSKLSLRNEKRRLQSETIK